MSLQKVLTLCKANDNFIYVKSNKKSVTVKKRFAQVNSYYLKKQPIPLVEGGCFFDVYLFCKSE